MWLTGVLGILSVLLFVSGITVVLLGRTIANRICFPKRFDRSFTWNDGISKAEFSDDVLRLPHQEFEVLSPFGYPLRGVCFPGSSEHSIIFVHGVSWTWHGMIKYMPSFLERGWNVIAFDQRAHGESGGENVSFGFFEKYDLKTMIDWVFERFPHTKSVGLFGESMGAGIVLQTLGVDPRPQFAIVDSPFSDLAELVRALLLQLRVPAWLIPSVLKFASFLTGKQARFALEEVSPIKSLSNSSVPLLILHGKSDDLIPVSMSYELQGARSQKTELVVVDCSSHARGRCEQPDVYEKAVWNFVRAVVPEV